MKKQIVIKLLWHWSFRVCFLNTPVLTKRRWELPRLSHPWQGRRDCKFLGSKNCFQFPKVKATVTRMLPKLQFKKKKLDFYYSILTLAIKERKWITLKQVRVPWWLSGKESDCQCRRMGSVPWSGRSTGEGNGNPLQDSCLGNRMDRGIWQAIVHGVTRVRQDLTTEQPQQSL